MKKISTKSKYVCVTRPRRFGKSSVVDMLGAYYSKAVAICYDSKKKEHECKIKEI